MRSFTHPNVLPCLDGGVVNNPFVNLVYIVMERMPGSLKDYLDKKQIMSLPVLSKIVKGLVSGVYYLHMTRGVAEE